MYLNIKEHRGKKVKLATFALTFLILGSLAFLMPTVQTQDPPSPVPVNQTVPLEGNLTFTFYPDESIKMKVIGSIEQAIDVYSAPPVYNAYLNLASSPSGVNLTDVTGTFVLKLNPMYSMLLAALELDIEVHAEGLSSNTTILFNMPGYLGVNGTTGAFTDESTGENNFDFDLTITIWYSLFPEEEIQGFIETFPTLESQIVTQISELMEGNVTLQDLTYSGETGFASATITITGSLVGDFLKGGNALSTNLLPLLGINDTETTSWISPEDLMYTKAKSADIHFRFDRNEFAFLMDSEGVIEGDLDRQINIMKDIYLEQILQYPDTPPEWALMINDVLLPTNISRKNLGMTLEYLFDGENIKLDFVVDGLVFRPPTIEAFLTFLDKALTGGSLPSFSLIFEGGSDKERFVEIEVPPTTSEPVMAFPLRVVWIIDNLTNLSSVSFKVIEVPPLPLKPAELVLSDLSITPEEAELWEGIDDWTFKITANVTNVGEQEGMDTINLRVDGSIVDWRTVKLKGGESTPIIFDVTRGVGSYTVEVEGLTGSFVVMNTLKPDDVELSELEALGRQALIHDDEGRPIVEGEYVIFNVLVENIGETEGTYTVEFNVRRLDVQTLWDLETISTYNVTLAAGRGHRVHTYYEALNTGTYQVSVGNLTETFIVRVPLEPAEFEFSNLQITPRVKIGMSVNISVDVTNVGEMMGFCTFDLKVNGRVIDSVEIPSFEGGVTVTQFFELTRGEGTYEVEFGGITGSFTVFISEPPFWNSTEFVMGVFVIVIGIIAIYIWRRGVLKT